jgi:preprotein translocase subunit SecD
MRRAGPILIVLIGVLALIVDFVPNLRIPDSSDPSGSRPLETRLGLDLRGGLRVEYQAQPAGDKTPTAADLSVIRTIIENRVNGSGVSEPVVTTQGNDRVVVELPGVSDPEAIRQLVGQTGQLDFVPLGQTQVQTNQVLDLKQYPPLFSGTAVTSATVGQDRNGRPAVDFVLSSDAAAKFADYTSKHLHEYFAITLDGAVISAPVIQDAIPNGQVQITQGVAGFPLKEAQDLVTVLKYGSLPFPIKEISSEQISATLGDKFLNQSLLAGFIGIALVIAFMLIYYRLPGAIASFALLYYTLVVLAIFRLIPVTLTLAGVAGFVLSVGMAVDANILIFERTKEELRVGKSLPAAVEAGFNRAWNSILDSNVSSLITATILDLFGSSVIRGFALVLIIGVLVSMFSAITVTRTIFRIIVQRGFARHAGLFGLRESEFTGGGVARGAAARREARLRV